MVAYVICLFTICHGFECFFSYFYISIVLVINSANNIIYQTTFDRYGVLMI